MHLRFTIRELLWLTLVVALAVGWWLERQDHLWFNRSVKQEHLRRGIEWSYTHQKEPYPE